MSDRQWRSVVVLCGGVGGARFLEGLAGVLPASALTAVVNTGDDFTHWGLHISPDLDTCMYTLAGISHRERGWGLQEESFCALEMMRRYGKEGWFQLGDRDLATHVARTAGLRQTDSLTDVTRALCSGLGVDVPLLPMADLPRPTWIDTADGRSLPFQDWLVKERAEPAVAAVRSQGPPDPAPEVIRALSGADLVLIAPSNPYVSIDPILALDGVREILAEKTVVAVSPIVQGRAVKGPLASMIWQLARTEPSAGAVAAHYGALLAGVVVESGDEHSVPDGVAVHGTATVMGDREDRMRLAREVLAFADSLNRLQNDQVWALVPIKRWDGAKTRLGPLFGHDRQRRGTLARQLAEHVLDELSDTGLGGVAVLTDDMEVARFARDRGHRVFFDPPESALSHAIDVSLAALARRGARAALVVMSDLPRLDRQDLHAVLEALKDTSVVLVPDRHGLGTNVLGLHPADAMATCFGHTDSKELHLAQAARTQLPWVVLSNENLGLDIDTPQDVLALTADPE